MEFNKEQLRAIEVRNKNILVSAAAGSGKTRVLVERIVRMILNKEISFDNILAMTFTKDAASEMKNRIKLRLLEIINSDEISDKEYLYNQINVIQNANISTIDSFCKKLIDENFSKVNNLDPNYRIADEKEINLIVNDCIKNLLDEIFIDNNDIYVEFLKCYFNKDESKIANMLISGLFFLKKQLKPRKFLNDLIDNYNLKLDEYYSNIVFPELKNELKDILDLYDQIQIDNAYEFYNNKLKIDEKKAGASDKYLKYLSYVDIANNAYNMAKEIFENFSIDALYDKLENFKKVWISQSGKVPDSLRFAINFNNKLNDTLSRFKKYIFIYKNNKMTGIYNDKLFSQLLLNLYNKVEDRKKEKNIIEISDLQKYAINLLYDENDNFTDIAYVLQDKFKQIYVDEYQDTSDIQEKLILALSNNYKNKNVFLVGDVKQSIYGFRNSKPQIFNEKMNIYKSIDVADCDSELINLNTNYRCSENIINFTNNVFHKIMTKEFSDIDYDDYKLNYGGIALNQDNRFDNIGKNIEIDVLFNEIKNSNELNVNNEDINNSKNKPDKEKNFYDYLISDDNVDKNVKLNKDDEAIYIAKRIRDLHDNYNINYNEIVILSRSASSLSDIYIKQFAKYDIPIVAELKTGFYISYEIRFMLNLLSIIDNPINDIKLASVLTSKFFNITNNELAYFKYLYKNNKKNVFNKFFSLYDVIINLDKKYLLEVDNKFDIDTISLKNKINYFLNLLHEFRYYSRYKSITELISIIYTKIDIYNYALSLNNGKVRYGNLDLLLDIAKSYENTSYTGLFNFIRFIEKMRDREEDESVAQVNSKNENVVRLMTIHKSKGLEFPIVIMPNLDKKYPFPEKYSDDILFDDKFGPLLNYIDYNNRYALCPYLKYKCLKYKKYESKKEEQRLMYVAFTRAKEKLILSYIFQETKDNKGKIFSDNDNFSKYPFEYIDNINYYREYLNAGVNPIIDNLDAHNDFVKINVIKEVIDDYDKINEKESHDIIANSIQDVALNNKDLENRIINNITTDYKFNYLSEFSPKYSVSQIKTVEDSKNDNDKFFVNNDKKDDKSYLNNLYDFDDVSISTDLNIDKERMDGSTLGNIYHKFMEKFDFSNLQNIPDGIDVNHIKKFVESELGKEIKYAYDNNNLFREQRFMKLFKMTEILNLKKEVNKNNKEFVDNIDRQLKLIDANINPDVVVQGVIDAFFINVDKSGNKTITLIDYKTDGLINDKSISETEFIDRYKIQMELYRKALFDITKITVSNVYIYSFKLDLAINLLL